MNGIWNKVIHVDLTQETAKMFSPGDNLFTDFIGGSGAAAKLFLDNNGMEADALAPESPLIIMTGPLTCSKFPGAMTRFCVAGRSPLTGFFCEASNGGSFGNFLKKCGCDGIIVTGAASKPVYLEITDDSCEIKDASYLWGKDTYETQDALVAEAEDKGAKKPSVLCIGQAGENKVKFANIMNGTSNFAGRGGLGAVMGAKNLKAITARGTRKPDFADDEKMSEVRKGLASKSDGHIAYQTMGAFGTGGAVDLSHMMGDLPVKNWRRASWDEGVSGISGMTMTDKILSGTASCLGCPVGCKRIVTVDDGNKKVANEAGPEYETLGAFGSMLLIDDLNAVAYLNELCNRYGMDTISCGGTISFATDLIESGIATADETGGFAFKWGDAAPVIASVHAIAKREGGGDLLAEGSREMQKRLGKGEECLVEVKGMEVPMHDPRAFWGMALNYAVGNRGACHVNTAQLLHEQGMQFFPEVGLEATVMQFTEEGKAAVNVKTQAVGGLMNSACICTFPAIPFDVKDIAAMLNSATGIEYTPEKLMEAGHRMWLLKRGINNLLGATRKDDYLPPRLLTPPEDGPTAGAQIVFQPMLDEFYELRGIDNNGRPSAEVLEKSGLEDLSNRLHGFKHSQT